ncbi:uncharacterized protein RHO25_011038 [Cercospora beticola]|uniref:Zn(2)-C6 fungal-type domain-containing protein n=2 Tax=Cercospora beticola TaxID=122368 RepID=A0ABZ0P3U1_CERBT|nr:hypothetical protein RHO25_011038 [Cercospora beticola]
MSEALLLQNTVNKPGTSCLGCRRRKLKCSREHEGCFNCLKSELPCVYPTPDLGVKRKRGPYKKDKPPRQRHLEDLVKYLEPKNEQAKALQTGDSVSPARASSSGASGTPYTAANERPTPQSPNQQSLVQDALVALTKSAAKDEDLRKDDGGIGLHGNNSSAAAYHYSSSHPHPSPARIFEYWSLFVTRVDPMVKIIHCPSFLTKIISLINNPASVSSSTKAMIFSMYYAALSTCSAQETRQKFGEGQEILFSRYGKCIMDEIRRNYEIPELEGLQALTLYIVCIRRSDSMTGIADLFHEAVRCAQLIKLEEEPEGRYSPFEVEYRRRLWYHLCGLESRTAEEGGSRKYSIFKDKKVELPRNLNDCDLNPRMTASPLGRKGITDCTFPILRFKIHRLVFGIWNIGSGSPAGTPGVTERQRQFYNDAKDELDKVYMSFMDETRPYDWLCVNFIEGMLTKARLLINFPRGTVPTKTMPEEERMILLESSVDIIKRTHALAVDDRISDWVWYFRGYVQWHSLAIVVAELAWSRDESFTNMAWSVLDRLLAQWDKLYQTKKDDPAWTHVNESIQRARKARQQKRSAGATQAENVHKRPRHDAPPIPQQTVPPPLQTNLHQQILQHRPASISNTTMPPQSTHYVPNAQAAIPMYNDGPTPESQVSAGSGSYEEFSPVDWNLDPFANTDWDAFNTVFTNNLWDDWLPMQNMDMGMQDGGHWWPPNQNVMPLYGHYQPQGQYYG